MSGKFSPEEDDVLIDLVRQHPPLYSVAGKSYKDLVVKNNIWKEIGAIMNKQEKACQTRWKHIRDYNQKKKREVIKGQKTGSVGNANVENFGVKYKHLSFLDNTSLVERKSISNLSASNRYPNPSSEQSGNISPELHDVLDESQADISDMEDSQGIVDSQADPVTKNIPNTQEFDEDQPPVVKESSIHPTTPSQRKRKPIAKERAAAVVEEIKKGRIERTKLMKDLLSPQSNKTKEDDTPISTFFRSIALTVEQLPPDLQTTAKVWVLHVISELEFQHQQRRTVDHGFRSASPSDQSRASIAASYFQAFSPQESPMTPLVESGDMIYQHL